MNLSNQSEIIENIANFNITVNAIAGSGKTTTIIKSVERYPDLKFLIITYNKSLQIETKEKLIKNTNVEVHTYHSFYTKYYDCTSHTDYYLMNNINANLLYNTEFDILILDEAQDIKHIYYNVIMKIIKDMKIKKLGLFGDHKQNIYNMIGSTTKFLLEPNLFDFQIDNWLNVKLKDTFRCSNKVVNLVNDLMNDPYMKESNIKGETELIYYNESIIGNLSFIQDKLKDLISEGFKPDQIMILYPSFKYPNIKKFINNISKQYNIITLSNINIDARSNLLLKNKILLSSIHSSKGLERDVVIFIPFNEIFNDMTHNKERLKCSNLLYVALTRSRKKLIVYKHIESFFISSPKKTPIVSLFIENQEKENSFFDKVSYINCENNENIMKNINEDIIRNKDLPIDEINNIILDKYKIYINKLDKLIWNKKKKKVTSYGVTDFLSYRPVDYYLFYKDKYDIEIVIDEPPFYIIKEVYNKDRKIYEDISAILGHMIPMYIELLLTNKIKLFEGVLNYDNLLNPHIDIKTKLNILQRNVLDYLLSKGLVFHYKKYQLPYDIICPSIFTEISDFGISVINQLKGNNEYDYYFEYAVSFERFKGTIDLLMINKLDRTDEIIVEFKVSSINDISNYVQIFMYDILYCESNKKDIKNVKLYYVNLGIKTVYKFNISEHYDELKHYIMTDNSPNSFQEYNMTLNDYITYIKSRIMD